MPRHTDPQDVNRRLALLPAGDMKIEVFCLRKRWAFGRWDVEVAPARGRGRRWVRQESLEYIEPEQGGDDE